MIDSIIDKYLKEYTHLYRYFRTLYSELDMDTYQSVYLYCFWVATKQYHPKDERFEEYFILILDSQLKQSRVENNKWIF